MMELYRRCPACAALRPAVEFRPDPLAEQPAEPAERRIRCPACRHVARSRAFRAAAPPSDDGGER